MLLARSGAAAVRRAAWLPRARVHVSARHHPTHQAAAALQQQAPARFSFADRPGVFDEQGRVQLKALTLPELEEFVESLGHEPRRASQLWKALYGDGRWLRSLEAPEPGASGQPLAAAFRAAVAAAGSIGGGLSLQSVSTAADATHKLVFAVAGPRGEALGSVETVLIPMTNKDGSQLRYTACVSSQVGCTMNCQFCLTGKMGLVANLSAAHIVEQLVEARRWLAERWQQQQQLGQQQQQQQGQQQQQQGQQEQLAGPAGPGLGQAAAGAGAGATSGSSKPSRRARAQRWPKPPPRINNIVFMGMGEPLHNLAAVMPALDIITHPQGLALSRSKVIVSTVGLQDEMRALRASGKAKLAVSLHATTDEVRSWIVPANRKAGLDSLLACLRELYPLPAKYAAASANTREGVDSDDFVCIEYVLLRGVNDSDDDAARLVELTRDIYCMINVIAFNPHEGTPFQRSDDDQVQRFRQIVQAGGKVCTLRISKGSDESAACGQLGNPGAVSRPAPLLKPGKSLQDKLPPELLAKLQSRMQEQVMRARTQAEA